MKAIDGKLQTLALTQSSVSGGVFHRLTSPFGALHQPAPISRVVLVVDCRSRQANTALNQRLRKRGGVHLFVDVSLRGGIHSETLILDLSPGRWF